MPDDLISQQRTQLRAQVRAARAALSQTQQAQNDAARQTKASEFIAEQFPTASCFACYLAKPGEPATDQIIASLAGRGRVLLPKMPSGKALSPDWAYFTSWSDCELGAHQIPQPKSARLGAEALAQAEVIIVAALAASPSGDRLGTGGGWYDRALLHAKPGAAIIALLNDAEIRNVPVLPHDQSVNWIITEQRVLACQPTS